ncbi:MAG: TIM barrel protein [Pirellulales bacterium]|nr:TIM barrel protein [Pirellulales bacterium]
MVFADRLGAAEASGGVPKTGEKPAEKAAEKGRLKQSVSRWCFGGMKLPQLAQEAAAMGLKSIELVGPKDWPVLKEHGLICAMTPSHDIPKGLNDKANHAECIESLKKSIEATGDAGFPNVVDLTGNRFGMADDAGLANYVEGIKKVVGIAEQKNVTICLEVLNSRRDHRDYMCDTVEWAVEACKRVGSPRLKILFDIYHVQIMQGDIIARIKQYREYIGHYHTAGVPGRHELDESQELFYPAIMRAIAETGFQGYIGHEFVPTGQPMKKLREAVELCDV